MSGTVDENWILFRNKLAHLADTYIPSINITCDKSKAWFTKTLNQLNRKKKRLFSRAKQLTTDLARNQYNVIAKIYKKSITEAKAKFFNIDT